MDRGAAIGDRSTRQESCGGSVRSAAQRRRIFGGAERLELLEASPRRRAGGGGWGGVGGGGPVASGCVLRIQMETDRKLRNSKGMEAEGCFFGWCACGRVLFLQDSAGRWHFSGSRWKSPKANFSEESGGP